MEHPFINPAELAEKSMDDLQSSISALTTKLNYAYRYGHGPLINQLNMALDSYRQAYSRKMDDIFAKQKIHPKISIQKDGE
jgi:hypothetical protein